MNGRCDHSLARADAVKLGTLVLSIKNAPVHNFPKNDILVVDVNLASTGMILESVR